MFTGIVQTIGQIKQLKPQRGDIQAFINTRFMMQDINLGDSIAVNGVCLTVTAKQEHSFAADISRESLSVTNLGSLIPGSKVHLERALTLQTPLGGHLVSGHVDGLGKVVERRPDGRSLWLRLAFPQELARYIAPKGSISLDGVSLTVNKVINTQLELNIVPHTLQETLLGEYREGYKINLEVDIIARYLERMLYVEKFGTDGNLGLEQASVSNIPSSTASTASISETFLMKHGFM